MSGRSHAGRCLVGPAGSATEVIVDEPITPDQGGTVASWLLDCPGQSPAWRHYLLAVVHLRPIEGVPPAVVNVPHATHEVLLAALDPAHNPTPDDVTTFRHLTPLNAVEQVELPDDAAAATLLELAAHAVLAGQLPAEPRLAGAREPWRTAMIKTSAHLRGEPHAP